MWISRYFVYFMIFSFCGWIYESIYVSIKEKKWDNRGFLYGPVVPIYGVGGASLMILMDIMDYIGFSYTWWMVFLVGFFGSAVLEYVTHWALEKLFHAYWWDYHYMPLNINGRICLPYTFCFGLAGLLGVYVLIPFFLQITQWISPILFELFSLVCMGLIAMDTALTVSALGDFSRKIAAMDEAFNARVEGLVENTRDELRTKFNKEQIPVYFENMGALHKSALKRVQGFAHPKKEDIHLDAILAELKKKMPKKKS